MKGQVMHIAKLLKFFDYSDLIPTISSHRLIYKKKLRQTFCFMNKHKGL